MENAIEKFRYPGLKPFTPEQEKIFFGRAGDVEQLFKRVNQSACTVVFGKSGVGKSSLINAGLLPKIRSMNRTPSQVTVLPPFHFGSFDENNPAPSLGEKLDKAFPDPASEDLFYPVFPLSTRQTVWYKLKALQYQAKREKRDETFLLIFDQLEEVFTYPTSQIREFLFSLSDLLSPNMPDDVKQAWNELTATGYVSSETALDVLYAPLSVKFLFAIKSEKLNLVSRLSRIIPPVLQNMYEVLPLSVEQATSAIVQPATDPAETFATPSFTYENEAIQHILNYLDQTEIESVIVEEKKSIEPFNLQIVCTYIERKFIGKKAEGVGVEPKVITLQQLAGTLGIIIKEFYRETLVENFKDEKERNEIARLILNEFIDERNKLRKMVYGKDLKEHEEAIKKLCFAGLLRREERSAKEVYYELSHDKLIEPILNEWASETWQWKTQGDTFFKQRKFSEAVELYTRYLESVRIENEPAGCAEVYKARGDAYAELNLRDQSTSDYQKALELNPNDTASCYGIGLNYFANGEHDEAEVYFDASARANPEGAASSFNTIGYLYDADKNYDKAERYYQKALEKKPDMYEAVYNLGRLNTLRKNFPEALEYFRKAIQLNPDTADTYNELGNAYYDMKEYDSAKTNYEQAIALQPSLFYAFYNLGLIERQNGDYKQAIDYFEAALKLKPDYESAYVEKGKACIILGELEKAVTCYEEIIRINPLNSKAYESAGLLYTNTLNLEMAVKRLNEAIHLKATDDAHYYLGLTYVTKGDLQEAEKNYRKALELNSLNKPCIEQLTELLIKQNKYDDLLLEMEKVIKQNPDVGIAYYSMGRAYVLKKDYQKARQAYVRSIEIDGESYDKYMAVAMMEEVDGRLDAAVLYYQKVLALNPDLATAHTRYGHTLEAQGKFNEALPFFAKAVELSPGMAEAYNDLGNIYLKTLDYDNALKNYEAAIAIDPSFFYSVYNIGLALESLKRAEEALTYYQKALEIKPDYTKALERIQTILQQTGRFDEAIAAALRLVELEPSAENYIKLGALYSSDKNDHSAAKPFLQKALDLEPDASITNYWMGIIEHQLKDKKAALAYLEKAVQLDKNFADAYYRIGHIKIDDGNFAEALGYFETTIKLDPNHSDAYMSLGYSYFSLNPFKKAEESFKNAIEKGGNNESLYIGYCNLAETQIRLEKYEEAILSCNKALEHGKDVTVFINMGEANEKLGNLELAKSCFESALREDENNKDAMEHLAALEKNTSTQVQDEYA